MTAKQIQDKAKNQPWWVYIIIALVTGPFINKAFNYLSEGRNMQFGGYEKIISKLEDEVSDLKEEIISLHRINEGLQDEIAKMRQKLLVVRVNEEAFPFPSWLKNSDFIMLNLNKHYEEQFLMPRGLTAADYVGFDDYKVWSKDIADKFNQTDNQVLLDGKIRAFRVDVPDKKGKLEEWIVIKYPRYLGKLIIGIGGIAIPSDKNLVNI